MLNNPALQPIPLNTSASEPSILPYALQTVTLTRQDYIELRWQSQCWKAKFLRVSAQVKSLKEELKQKNRLLRETIRQKIREAKCAREEALLLIIQEKEAMIRDLSHRLYGKGSEKTGHLQGEGYTSDPLGFPSKRSRGQQKGSVGHGRTDRSDLPVVEESIPLTEDACPQCQKAYLPLPNEESSIIEIHVHAYTRRLKRQRGVKNCACIPGSSILTAPLPSKLLPKSPYGSSVWEEVLLSKFLYAEPIHRILNDFKSLGLQISPGSIAGGLKHLAPLFVPICKAFHVQQMTENQFHNDETRWAVYEPIEGKAGRRWYLWVTRSASVIYYCMDPTRNVDAPLAHFAGLQLKTVIIICDRYCVYKKLAKLNSRIILAFCWAHVRRDFLKLVRAQPDLKEWGLDWVNEIGRLYHLNHERLALWNATLPLAQQSPLFQEKHEALKSALEAMQVRCNILLESNQVKENEEKTSTCLTARQRKVLVGLQNHWQGLTVFYDHPQVKMDNNAAEQAIRNPVIGRKGYYGSGSVWSAELAAMMFSIFQTLLYCWNLNPRTWLRGYLKACSHHGGRPPHDLSEFLPWQMNEASRQKWSKPPLENSS